MPKKIKLTYLKKSTKFLLKNKTVLTEFMVDDLIVKFVKKRFYNIETNIDVKQMQGKPDNIYRIRKGNIRILIKVLDNEIIVEIIVFDIGFRGDVYK